MRIINYDKFVNESEIPKTLQGFILQLDYFYIGSYYTLPDFLDVVFENETGDPYKEEDLLLSMNDLMDGIESYDESINWENVAPRLWCGLKLNDMSKERYTTLPSNPYSAVATLDSWFIESKRVMTLHGGGNWKENLTWLATSITNDNNLVGPYAEKHPDMIKGAIDLLKSGDQDKMNALIKYNKIKGFI